MHDVLLQLLVLIVVVLHSITKWVKLLQIYVNTLTLQAGKTMHFSLVLKKLKYFESFRDRFTQARAASSNMLFSIELVFH